jgi:hypothetical protein
MSHPAGPKPSRPGEQSVRDSWVGRDSIQIINPQNVQIISGADSDARRTTVRGRPRARLVVTGGVLLLATTIAATWPTPIDIGRDLVGVPAITATVTSTIYAGDTFAMATELAPAEHALLSRDPSIRQLTKVLSSHRAARVGGMNVLIVLQGQRDNPIRIIDVRPRIIRSGPPPSGTCLTVPAQGSSEEYTIKADLDRQRPGGGAPRFLSKSIDLAYGERTTIEMTVKATRRWYEWDIEVIYAHGSGTRPASAFFRGSDGQPFRVTGKARKYAAVYNDPSSIFNGYRLLGRNRPCAPH